MSKYIDAEKLKAEVEKRREDIKAYCLNPNHDKRYDVVPEQLAYILDIIDSIQQEQPEVDLEKEIQEYIQKLGFGYGGWVDGLSDEDLKNIARYFYELGLKSK